MGSFLQGVQGRPSASDDWVKISEADRFQRLFVETKECFTNGSYPISQWIGSIEGIISLANTSLSAILGATPAGQRNLQNLNDAIALANEFKAQRGQIDSSKFKQDIKTYNNNLEKEKVAKYLVDIKKEVDNFNNAKLVSRYTLLQGDKYPQAWYTCKYPDANINTLAALGKWVTDTKEWNAKVKDQINGKTYQMSFPTIEQRDYDT